MFLLHLYSCYNERMPTLDELQRIAAFTNALEPEIAAALRVIFLLTEHDSQYMNDYIAVAVGAEAELSDTVRDILCPYHLVGEDGSIPVGICQAICRAVDMQYLEVRKDGHKIRCATCGGPHQTEDHHDWVYASEDMISEDLEADLEKYPDIVEAFKSGGFVAVERVLRDKKITMNHNRCFCGSSAHSSVDHLRWLVDQVD